MKSLIRATLCAAALSSAQAASLNFERSQTLNGWHERAHTGKFVLTKSSPAGMGPVTFTAAELAPHADRTLTLNLINTAAGGDMFYVNWPIRIPGTHANDARANALADKPGDAPAGLVWMKVKLPDCLSSHMVLQRDMPVPIWGTAEPNAKISVKFRGRCVRQMAGQAGPAEGRRS